MSTSTPRHYLPSLRGAPILPPARLKAQGLRIAATTPDEFTSPARRPAIPTDVDAIRNVVVFHLADGELLGEDAGTIRRVVQVDLNADLGPRQFATLVAKWPRLGYFPTEVAREEWLDRLDVMLRDAALIA